MANTDSARKRSRQAEKQRRHNASLRSTLRSAIKDVAKAIAGGDKAGAKTALNQTSSIKHAEAVKRPALCRPFRFWHSRAPLPHRYAPRAVSGALGKFGGNEKKYRCHINLRRVGRRHML